MRIAGVAPRHRAAFLQRVHTEMNAFMKEAWRKASPSHTEESEIQRDISVKYSQKLTAVSLCLLKVCRTFGQKKFSNKRGLTCRSRDGRLSAQSLQRPR